MAKGKRLHDREEIEEQRARCAADVVGVVKANVWLSELAQQHGAQKLANMRETVSGCAVEVPSVEFAQRFWGRNSEAVELATQAELIQRYGVRL